MALHFDIDEYQARIGAAQAGARGRGLDGVLLFAPESHYYLCGYDTFGFALFQCMVLPADGELHLLTRAPDLRQAQQTSILSDAQIHIWKDDADADPYSQLADLLSQLGLRGKRLGIETHTAGLTAFHGKRVEAALAGAELVEASDLVREQRRLKSSAEIECHRRAAALSDDALDAAIAATRAGAFEGDILAAMTLDAHGLNHARLNACGYGMGATFSPSWMEPPMFYRGNPLLMKTDHVFFMHMILMDSEAGLAMCVGHSVRVTDAGCERLSRHGLDLIER